MPPTSWNFCTVVMTVRPLGPLSRSRRSRTLSARSGFGKPQARKVPLDLLVEVAAVGDDHERRVLVRAGRAGA